MNNSLRQNIASSSGGLIAILLSVLLFTDPDSSTIWVRVCGNAVTAVLCLLACYAAVKILSNKQAGHRFWTKVLLGFFAFRVIFHVWSMVVWLKGIPHMPVFMSTMGNSWEGVVALYFFSIWRDLATTYSDSEVAREARMKNLVNLDQGARNLRYLLQLHGERADKLTEFIEHVSRAG